MSLLYRALRALFRVLAGLWFTDIQVTGDFDLPDGPLILAANHPNSLMDGVVLAVVTDRQIHYLGRAGLFKRPLAARLLRALGVIPVHRRSDGPSPEGANEDAFAAAHELLAGGGCLGIFPEGRNAPERHVRELKTGAARIALGAQRLIGSERAVKIVPVGINLENRDRFMSAVLVRFGEALDARDWAGEEARDPKDAARAMTGVLQERLRAEALHITDDRIRAMADDLFELLGGREIVDPAIPVEEDLRSGLGRLFDELRAAPESAGDLDAQFEARKRIAEILESYRSEHPQAFLSFAIQLRRYTDHLEQVRLRLHDHDVPPEKLSARREAAKLTAYALAFGPVAAWGFVHNVLPYKLAKHAGLSAAEEAIRAGTTLIAALIAFPGIYALYGWLMRAGYGWGVLATSLYLASLPPAGFFFLRYRRQLARGRDRLLARTLLLTRRARASRLAAERERVARRFAALLD